MILSYKKIKILLSLIIFSPILFLLIFLRPFLKIKIIEIETRAIGHYSYPMEIFLCEIKNQIHGNNNIYIAYRNKIIANKFLYNKIKKDYIILPRIILQPIFLFFNHIYVYNFIGKYFLADYRHWTRNYTHDNPSQQIDVYDVLKKTPPTIVFTDTEKNLATETLKKLNINKDDNYVCIHPRTPYYYKKNNIIKKFKYQLRDSTKDNLIEAINYLDNENIKIVLLGEDIKNFHTNKKIIYYNKSNLKSDFLDIYLLSGCKYLVGNSSGMSMTPMIFRKKSLYTNISEIHALNFIDSFYKPLIVLKKFKSLKTGDYLPYSVVLEKKLSEVNYIEQLNEMGFDIEDNSNDEILNATKEMNYFIDNNRYLNSEINFEKKFNNILVKYKKEPLNKSKISNFFLQKNSFLLD